MLNKIKIICADLLEAKNEKAICTKETNKLLEQIISDTAGGNFPESTDIVKLSGYIEREVFAIETIKRKIEELKKLAGAAAIEQMKLDEGGI